MKFSDQCLAQLFSEKLPLAVYRDKYRVPQTNNRQRMRDLGTLRSKRKFP